MTKIIQKEEKVDDISSLLAVGFTDDEKWALGEPIENDIQNFNIAGQSSFNLNSSAKNNSIL